MIPFTFSIPPSLFKALILLHLLPSSLQINPHKPSTPYYLNHNSTSISPNMPANPQKKLQRLPHVFSRILELPLRSQADVFIEDRPDCFRFTASVEDGMFCGRVRAYAVTIHPGVMKVVVRGGNCGEVELLLEKLEVDVWRFRLPKTTRPELATAVVKGRELVVTVPKGGRSSRGGSVEDEDEREVWGGGGGRVCTLNIKVCGKDVYRRG